MKHAAFLNHLGIKTTFVGSKVVVESKKYEEEKIYQLPYQQGVGDDSNTNF